MMNIFRKTFLPLWIFSGITGLIAIYMIFAWVQPEETMGEVQKIFYYHVPSAMSAYLFFFISFLFAIIFLLTKDREHDIISLSSAEIGLLFLTIVLITGPIWGRSAWGKWWVWEPRLTTALITFLMYTAYFLLRTFGKDETKMPQIAAILSIIAFFNVPIIHQAIKWWGSIVHPSRVTLSQDMKITFMISMTAVISLAVSIFTLRIRVEDRLTQITMSGEIP